MVVKYWEQKGLLRQPSRERLKWVYQHKKQHQDMRIPQRLWSYQLLQILSQSLDLGSPISRYRLHPAIQTHRIPGKFTLKNWWQVFGSMEKLLQYLNRKHKTSIWQKRKRRDSNTYINETVMEMKTNERSSHPSIGLQGVHNLSADNWYKIRAWFSVNVRV